MKLHFCVSSVRASEVSAMATFLQVLKSAVSIPQPNFSGRSSPFFYDSDSKKRFLQLHNRRRNSICFYVSRRSSFRCAAQDSDKQSNGEEPPESLFMKELKKRGLTPTSLLEDTNSNDLGLGSEASGERGFSSRSAVSTEVNKSLADQREISMQLNSEGLEGLIPRAKLLLTIGGTFFLAFWPLIIITLSLFFALYFFFGTSFVHDGSETPVSPPQYVDPYALLEDVRISQTAPNV